MAVVAVIFDVVELLIVEIATHDAHKTNGQ